MIRAPYIAASPSTSSYTAKAPPSLAVFLPKEHGSWSLAFEPILLGLLVAPSGSGIALAIAAVAGFFVRRPFKAALSRSSQPRQGALTAVILLSLSACVGLGEAIAMAGAFRLWPLLLAVPFGGLFGYFDTQGDSREAAAELAGSTAFGLLPATFAILAGWPVPAALALACIAIARSAPTVLTVRTYIRLRKGKRVSALLPMLAAMIGCTTVVVLAALRLIPWLSTVGAWLLLARTNGLLSIQAPNWSAKRVGITEAILGIAYIALVTLAYRSQ